VLVLLVPRCNLVAGCSRFWPLDACRFGVGRCRAMFGECCLFRGSRRVHHDRWSAGSVVCSI
jgi:hypothetical protein